MSDAYNNYTVKDGILVTNYKNVVNLFEIASSKIYYTDDACDTNVNHLIKKIKALHNPKIECNRIFSNEITGISIGCADTCNLACTYCYAHAGTYHSTHVKKIMDTELFNKLFDYLVHLPHPVQTITFFGGEPLLAFKDIKEFIPKLNAAYKKIFDTVPKYAAITNGTLITDEMADFFNRYFYALSISIDGPKQICDKTRIFLNPRQSVHDTIRRAMNILNKKKRNYFLAASATLSPDTMIQAQALGAAAYRRSFFALGFDQVAIFEASGIPWPDESLQAAYRFYEGIIEETFGIITKKKSSKLPDNGIMALLVDILKQHYTGDCVAGKSYFYYTIADGIYPCQLYYNARKRERTALRRIAIKQCQSCPALNVCDSHCGGAALYENGDENIPVAFRCAMTLFKLDQVIKRLGYYAFYKETNEAYQNIINAVKTFAAQNAVSNIYTP